MLIQIDLVIFDADGTLTPQRDGSCGAFSFETLPGVRERCAELRADGVKLAIASNQSAQRPVEQIVQQMTWTAGAIGCNDMGNIKCARGYGKKPSPFILWSLMNRYEMRGTNVLFVGDQETDKQAAEAAGCHFCWAHEFFREELGVSK